MTATATEHHAGFVALAGRSNVGKSTLLNRMVGHKIAAVSHRPQTTRRRIVGIRRDENSEIVLIDMPGLHKPYREMNRRMVQTAWNCIAEGEVVVAVIEAGEKLRASDREFVLGLEDKGRSPHRPVIVAINKIDLVRRAALIAMVAECGLLMPESEIVPVSARTGENMEELVATIRKKLPAGPALMDPEQHTDQTARMIAEEIIREKIFVAMRKEIPFSTAVTVEDFAQEAEPPTLTRIAAVIVVERESHKGMVIGAGGRQLKQIGSEARLELEEVLGTRIFLQLTVKVEANWTRDPRRWSEFGL
ncbi:MAG TPA: GTPase Era [Candidatus Binataceae bacterium]